MVTWTATETKGGAHFNPRDNHRLPSSFLDNQSSAIRLFLDLHLFLTRNELRCLRVELERSTRRRDRKGTFGGTHHGDLLLAVSADHGAAWRLIILAGKLAWHISPSRMKTHGLDTSVAVLLDKKLLTVCFIIEPRDFRRRSLRRRGWSNTARRKVVRGVSVRSMVARGGKARPGLRRIVGLRGPVHVSSTHHQRSEGTHRSKRGFGSQRHGCRRMAHGALARILWREPARHAVNARGRVLSQAHVRASLLDLEGLVIVQISDKLGDHRFLGVGQLSAGYGIDQDRGERTGRERWQGSGFQRILTSLR
jgi:hypothetical protein